LKRRQRSYLVISKVIISIVVESMEQPSLCDTKIISERSALKRKTENIFENINVVVNIF
jgi:hypothetical protein